MQHGLAETTEPGPRWLGAWILVCALAEWLGIGAAALWYGAVTLLFGEPAAIGPRIGVGAMAMLAAVPEGLALGGLQGLWLRRLWPRLSLARWIGATIVVGMIGWGAGTFIPLFVFPDGGAAPETPSFDPSLGAVALFAALFGFAVGTVFDLGQAFALPAPWSARRLWIAGNAAGWMIGLPLIYVAAHIASDLHDLGLRIGLWMAGGMGAGLAVGAGTAVAVLTMARR